MQALHDFKTQLLRELSAAARQNMNLEAYNFIQRKLEDHLRDTATS